MKTVLAVVLFVLVALWAQAYTEEDVGSSRYLNESTSTFQEVVVAISIDGTVRLKASGFDYFLTSAEKDKLAQLVSEGLRLITVAAANKTTLTLDKTVGAVYLSIINGSVTVSFQTDGWEKCSLRVWVQNSGKNVGMVLNKKQAEEFVANLNKATNESDDHARQAVLFQ